jgi:hypothetical protein
MAMADRGPDMLYVGKLQGSDGAFDYEFAAYSRSDPPPIQAPRVMVWVHGWPGDIVFDRARGVIDAAASLMTTLLASTGTRSYQTCTSSVFANSCRVSTDSRT